MMPQITENTAGYRLALGGLSVTALRHGAKLSSIVWGGREWLAAQPGSTAHRSAYGDGFLAHGPAGFDEMFPNIGAGPYPGGPWDGVMLPDHGEVWSRDWEVAPEDGALVFRIRGVALPYLLEKRLALSEDAIRLSYRAENLSDHPMQYIWAAHPLFVLEDGMRLELPGCREIFNAAADPGNLGAFGDIHPWPVSRSGRDMGLLSGARHAYNKYYVWNELPENRAILRYPGGVRLTLDADVPYLGVWTDEAGYGEHPMRCAAPEPCTGALDRLDLAAQYHRNAVLPPRGGAGWRLTITFERDTMAWVPGKNPV